MVRRSALASVLALCVCAAAPAGNIVIRNGSFEADLPLGDGGIVRSAPAEWSIGGDDPDDVGYQNCPSSWITPPAIDGELSAFIDGMNGSDPSWIAQELQYADASPVLASEGLLVDLEFHVGRKVSPAGNTPPIVKVVLECGPGGPSATFADDTYYGNGLGLGSWGYVHVPLIMTGVTGSGYEGQPVVLKFFNLAVDPTDWHAQASLDAVAIVPEPATLGLLALGGTALIRRRRRK